MTLVVDLNADLGESFGRWPLGNDSSLMPHVTSANIACGWHGGDPHQMRAAVELALEHGVGIGAHTGFPDLLGFGRRRMLIPPAELRDYVVYQLGALWGFVRALGGEMQHVKPHGAFYVTVSDTPPVARAVAEAIYEVDPELFWITSGAGLEAAEAVGVRAVPEAYVDLDYSKEGELILERSVIPKDPARMGEVAVRLIKEQKLATPDGGELELAVRTICIHGDAPNAPEVARVVTESLRAAGVEVAPLARHGATLGTG